MFTPADLINPDIYCEYIFIFIFILQKALALYIFFQHRATEFSPSLPPLHYMSSPISKPHIYFQPTYPESCFTSPFILITFQSSPNSIKVFYFYLLHWISTFSVFIIIIITIIKMMKLWFSLYIIWCDQNVRFGHFVKSG